MLEHDRNPGGVHNVVRDGGNAAACVAGEGLSFVWAGVVVFANGSTCCLRTSVSVVLLLVVLQPITV